MMPALRETVVPEVSVPQFTEADTKCRERREEIMRRAAAAMRELRAAVELASTRFVEGDLDLADLIVPAR